MSGGTKRKVPASPRPQLLAASERPFPERFFSCMTSYAQGAALKGAIELDLFTVLSASGQTVESLALRLQTSVRGTRILCDYLTVEGFLTKEDNRYSATQEVATFLNRRSPAYIGSAALFLGSQMLLENFRDLAGCVRKGGTVNASGTLAPEHPIWVEFAHSMAPMAAMDAELIARILNGGIKKECKILDIAAGHGMYGIALGRHNPEAEIVALDWKNVLAVARENARKAGIGSRYHTIEGSAFEVDFGGGYDIVLLTNFLHHFNAATNESLLRKVHAALRPKGRAVVLEFIPNPDRLTPPLAAEFSLMMLASTPEGDAFTFQEFEQMFNNAGFQSPEIHDIPPSPERVLVGTR